MKTTQCLKLTFYLCAYICAASGRHIGQKQPDAPQNTNSRVNAIARNRIPWNPSAWFHTPDSSMQRTFPRATHHPVNDKRPDAVNIPQNKDSRVNSRTRSVFSTRLNVRNSRTSIPRNTKSSRGRQSMLRIKLNMRRPFDQRGLPKPLNHRIQITTGNQRRKIQISHSLGVSRPVGISSPRRFSDFRKSNRNPIHKTTSMSQLESVKPDTVNVKSDINNFKPDMVYLQPEITNKKPEIASIQSDINNSKNPKQLSNTNIKTAPVELTSENQGHTSGNANSMKLQTKTTATEKLGKQVVRNVSSGVTSTNVKLDSNKLANQSINSDKTPISTAPSPKTTTMPGEVTTEEPDSPDLPDLPDLPDVERR